jgi:S-adenosylmethionine:tRNA ribosyltransferase-isomerase
MTTTTAPASRPTFDLPAELIADAPAEARGLRRDQIRLLVARKSTGAIVDTTMTHLGEFLAAGDVVAVNTSATIPAAVSAHDGRVVHFSTELPGGFWVVEVRQPCGAGSLPFADARSGERIDLVGGGRIELLDPFPAGGPPRLWLTRPRFDEPVVRYLTRHGRPIRYGCTETSWPISAYQTVFGMVPGSAEMPSASRGFTRGVVADLQGRGIEIAPLTLHTGVSSQEAHEPPYPERYQVPLATADAVNAAHDRGNAVIAIGTTVTRALETVVDDAGRAHAGEGWTEVVVTPERGVKVVDGLLTGWHEPEASHLRLLEAVTGRELLDRSYDEALRLGYQWHEFGDAHLIVP